MRRILRSTETLVTIVLLIVSAVFLFYSLQLPAGEFDPLGAGTTPAMVAVTLILLCAIVLIRIFFGENRDVETYDEPIDILERTGEPTPKAFAAFITLLVLYVLGFHFQLGHFIVLTTIFVFVTMLVLGDINKKNLVTAIVTSVVLSVSLFLILTKFFVIRLPGAF